MFCFCSRMERERMRAPWRVNNNEDSFWVEDVDGQRFAFTYYRGQPLVGTDRSGRVSRDMARRIAANVARLPDLLRALHMVNWRQQNTGKDGF
jgi:hypothetical protein